MIQLNQCVSGTIPGCINYKNNLDGNNDGSSNSFTIECEKCVTSYYGINCQNEAMCWGEEHTEEQDKLCAGSAKCLGWTNWPDVDYTANFFDCQTCSEGNIFI